MFLLTLGGLFTFGEYDGRYLPMVFVSLSVMAAALIVWCRQDMSFDGSYEPRSVGVPFKNIQIRKVGVWVFLMSEMMIFKIGRASCRE